MTPPLTLATFVILWTAPPAVDMTAAVPCRAAVAVFLDAAAGRSRTAQPPADGMSVAAFLLRQARQVGLTSGWGTNARIFADVVASLPLAAHYPMAVVLLDARAKPLSSGGYRLAGMRGAIVLGSNAQNRPVTHRIQELLNLYADRRHSTITRHQAGDVTSFALTDTRLPEWVVIEWGAVEAFFVIALGNGSFQRVAGAIRSPDRSIRTDEWFSAAHDRCAGPKAFLEIYVDIDALRGQLEEVMAGKPEQVAAGLGLAALQRGLWAVGRTGRVVEASCVLRSAGQDRYVPITLSPRQCRLAADAVPDRATTYTILNVPAGDLLQRARDGYLASKSESSRARIRRLWRRYVDDTTWSVEADFLDQLGDRVLFHNDPPHPLGIPLLCTILIEVDGSAERVSDSIDRLLAALQQHLTPTPNDPTKAAFAPVLQRAPDGVWHVQAGLVGPTLAVTERWIVISYAPQAVRANVRFLQHGSGVRPTTKPAVP